MIAHGPKTISIIIPAKNEASSLSKLLPKIKTRQPEAEIIVVDDGSTDDTRRIAESTGTRVISHPYSSGNGSAVKTGAASARGEILVFMDGDGQHDPADISSLLEKLDQGYDMAVGARSLEGHASIGRRVANGFYNRLASWVTGHLISDLTSGFRAVRSRRFREFLHLLPNGFSYPTTITMAFFRAGYPVAYVPVDAKRRDGSSHIRPLYDGVRFLLIIFRVGTLYSPLKLFAPISFIHGLLGLLNYMYTYFNYGRFTNMSALLLISAVIILVIGLISEQITNLLYTLVARHQEENPR